jgi:adenylate cyclase
MPSWQELKRRSVFRVGAVYLAVAWLIAQIVSVISEPLSLPNWFDTVVIVALAAGFPVALVLAWALEITPDGIRRDTGEAGKGEAEQRPIRRMARGRTVDFAIIAALVAALGLTLWNRDAPAPANSIAVVRFQNQTDDADQNYLSSGIPSEILNRLIPVEGLSVAGENSSFQFDVGTGDYATIGRALNVSYVLEGSFIKSGDRIRVRPRLVRSRDGVAVWSDAYDGEGDDIFTILPQIAISVADALSVELGIREPQMRYFGTESGEAFDSFLRGREVWRTNPPRAIEEFTTATQIDPDYALPWAWMSYSYGFLVLGARSQAEFDRNFSLMEAAARRAVALGPQVWVARDALAWALLGESDWIGANEAWQQGVNLARSDGARMNFQSATFIEVFGDLEETVRRLEALREIDPLNPDTSNFLRNALGVMGRYEDARAESERLGLTFAADGITFPWFMGQGRTDLVQAWLAQAPAGSPGNRLSSVFASRDATLALIREIQAEPGFRNRPSLINLVFWAAYYEDTDLAVELLRKAFLTDGWGNYFLIWHDVLSETRRTPEFRQFMRDLGFVELWRQTGEWGDYCKPLPGNDDFECI